MGGIFMPSEARKSESVFLDFIYEKITVRQGRLLRYCFHHNPLKYETDYYADALLQIAMHPGRIACCIYNSGSRFSVLFAKVWHTGLCEGKIVCHREVHFPFGLPITRTVPDSIAYSETICVTARAENVVKLSAKPRRNYHNSFRKCEGFMRRVVLYSYWK